MRIAKFYQQTLLTILKNVLTFENQLFTMNDTELLHLLALLKVEGVGDIIAKKLLNHCGTAENIFKTKASKLNSIDGIGQVLMKKMKDKSVFLMAEKELRYIKDNQIVISYFLHLRANQCIHHQNISGTFNLGSGNPISMLEIAKLITNKFGNQYVFSGLDVNENDRWNIALSKIKEQFNFTPNFTSKEAIENLLCTIHQ